MKKTYLLLGLVLLVGIAADTSGRPIKLPGGNNSSVQRTPAPQTVDQITHNAGNLVTTIDNYGYIGGYESLGLPSGEWPRNSGHSYIGELFYWMGAITPSGDTLVADAYEDFQAIPSLISGQSRNKILLSTDTSRFYDFNPSDTVGAGLGNAARGWREYNADSGQYIYSQNYNPQDSSFVAGGPRAVQVSHYRFNDAAEGTSLLGLEMTQTVLQWNYCYNEDFLFVILEITNNSSVDYNNFAFALYSDIDVGGPDGSGENGRLHDLIAYDTTENLAWTYDEKGTDPGWGNQVRTGIMGTKYLETPDNIGMTALRNEAWELVPQNDPERFVFMTGDGYDSPLPPGDQLYLQCTKGINLEAGKTVRVVFALIGAANETEFRNSADLAQELYDNYFVGPQPPTTPRLLAEASDGKVYLRWNDSAELSVDPLSGAQDFAGYKLYRSSNQGRTWGEPNYKTNNNCLDLDYTPIGLYTVNTPGDPVVRSVVDSGLSNGVEYWYCLAAIDTGASSSGVDPLQSGFGIAGQQSNVVAVTPRTDPVGFFEAASTVTHEYTGTDQPSLGSVVPILFDRDSLQQGTYSVRFEDRPEISLWHLINETTNDTLLKEQTRTTGDPGFYEIASGLRVVVRSVDRAPALIQQTVGGTQDLLLGEYYGASIPVFTGDPADAGGDAKYRDDYEIRFTGDSTIAPSVIEYWVPGPTFVLPFEVWNISRNQRVSAAIYDYEDDGIWQPYDLITIVDNSYEPSQNLTDEAFPYEYAWMFGFNDASYSPSNGDVFTILGPSLNSPYDRFVFRIDGVSAADASAQLNQVRVVPNPYFARYSSMVETNPGEAVMEFQRVPDTCTIRIYTVAGDLVRTLENEGIDGTVRWNLQTIDHRQVASGLYVYHVDSPYGTHIGRFAVIK